MKLRKFFLGFAFCWMWCLEAQKQNPAFIEYKLIDKLPGVLIWKETEEIGATWQKGRIHDQPVVELFYQLVNTNTHGVVLDIGAQTGVFTLLAKYFPQSKWYAFEPIEEAAEVLKKNLKLNAISCVDVFSLAISDQKGTAVLKLPTDEHWGLTTLGDAPKRFGKFITRTVNCIDLDTFVTEKKIEKVDFIKIDTEGWELHVLQGGQKMIQRDHPTILMEFNFINMEQCRVEPNEVLDFLDQIGYQYKMVSTDDLMCVPKEVSSK